MYQVWFFYIKKVPSPPPMLAAHIFFFFNQDVIKHFICILPPLFCARKKWGNGFGSETNASWWVWCKSNFPSDCKTRRLKIQGRRLYMSPIWECTVLPQWTHSAAMYIYAQYYWSSGMGGARRMNNFTRIKGDPLWTARPVKWYDLFLWFWDIETQASAFTFTVILHPLPCGPFWHIYTKKPFILAVFSPSLVCCKNMYDGYRYRNQVGYWYNCFLTLSCLV